MQEIEIEEAVVVEIEEGSAGADDLRHEIVANRPRIVNEVQADLRGYILKKRSRRDIRGRTGVLTAGAGGENEGKRGSKRAARTMHGVYLPSQARSADKNFLPALRVGEETTSLSFRRRRRRRWRRCHLVLLPFFAHGRRSRVHFHGPRGWGR